MEELTEVGGGGGIEEEGSNHNITSHIRARNVRNFIEKLPLRLISNATLFSQ